MSLTYIVGNPGSGKTYFAVNKLYEYFIREPKPTFFDPHPKSTLKPIRKIIGLLILILMNLIFLSPIKLKNLTLMNLKPIFLFFILITNQR